MTLVKRESRSADLKNSAMYFDSTKSKSRSYPFPKLLHFLNYPCQGHIIMWYFRTPNVICSNIIAKYFNIRILP